MEPGGPQPFDPKAKIAAGIGSLWKARSVAIVMWINMSGFLPH
jgi:hypothetical protein